MTIIKPGNFGKNVPADNRRGDFDFGNEQVLYLKRSVDILFIGDSITQLWDSLCIFRHEMLYCKPRHRRGRLGIYGASGTVECLNDSYEFTVLYGKKLCYGA